MSYLERFRIRPGAGVKLAEIDPSFKDRHESQEAAAEEIEQYRKRLCDLQEMLYVERRRSLLICLQGLDAAGKDGTIKHFLGAMNPQGCPSRSSPAVGRRGGARFPVAGASRAPARGEVAIFNRSHYEDVLVVRVHKLVPKPIWSRALRAASTPSSRDWSSTRRNPQVLPAHLEGGAARALQGSGSTIRPSSGRSARPITRSAGSGTTT